MTASREIGKKAQEEPMSKWGLQPPNGAQSFFKNYLQILRKNLMRFYDLKFKIFG